MRLKNVGKLKLFLLSTSIIIVNWLVFNRNDVGCVIWELVYCSQLSRNKPMSENKSKNFFKSTSCIVRYNFITAKMHLK